MKAKTIDTTVMDAGIKTLEAILEHRRARPAEKSDEMYYELLIRYLGRVRTAKDEGKYLVAHTVVIPTEILFAMDIIPMHLEFTSMTLTQLTDMYEQAWSTAKAFGFTPEICSAHRNLNAHCILGTLPKPDAVIWSNQVCDNTSKSGDAPAHLYGCPGFFLDRPYRYTENDVQYFTEELGDLVQFLEELTHQKLDWDRLNEALKQSQRMIELHREILELRKAVPAPMRNRRFMQIMAAEWYYSGAPDVIGFLEQVRDEIKDRVEAKVGFVPEERYRLLNLFLPPMNMWKLLDWMEREYGAVSVMEPYCSHWGPGEIDLERPLESLARKSFYQPICRQMHGPVEEGIFKDSIDDAIEYKAEGAIYWAHIGCRQSDACIKILKDGLSEKAGIPTLVVDNDICDPTYATEEQIKDKLEGFFEVLEDRK
ncbi:MAG: 2-hydroxyacyl-CoA dehydratase family protein [Pseudomonadota bacterium]